MLAKRIFKNAVYDQVSRISKALSSPKRLEILDLLCQRTWTVEELSIEVTLSVANTSRHLQVLRAAQLVQTEKKGLFVAYTVAGDAVCITCRNIQTLAERQLAEIERITKRFADGHEEFVSIDRDSLLKRLRDGSATLIDVRPYNEYSSGHLSGAISIPVDKLAARLRELPRDQQIVAYCRGPYCLFASDAVRLLLAKGFNAVRYAEGVADWRAAGLPIAVGIDIANEPVSKKANASTSTQNTNRRKP